MTTTKTIAASFAIAFLAIGFAAPAAAQTPSQEGETPGQQGIMTALANIQDQLDHVSQQLQDVQQRLDSLENRVDSPQAQEREMPEAEPQEMHGQSNGAQVNHSVEVENGTKTIRHQVTKNGDNLASWVKQIDLFDEPEEPGERPELQLSLEGNVSIGNNVTLAATSNNSSVANATVKINGETAGETNSQGEFSFTVPEAEELEIEVYRNDLEEELEIELGGGTEVEEREQGDER